MSDIEHLTIAGAAPQAPWDARLARKLVAPLKDSCVAPNHLTTVRLLTGLAAAAAFLPGTYGSSNVAALLLIVSNFADHTDGELARMSGKTSRSGHVYDRVSDAAVTIVLLSLWASARGLSSRGHSRRLSSARSPAVRSH